MRTFRPPTPSAMGAEGSFLARTSFGHTMAALVAVSVLAAACATGSAPTRPPVSATLPPPTPATGTAQPTPQPEPTPNVEPSVTLPASAAPTTSAVPAFPLTLIDDEGAEVTIETQPERVVSLTPATTELLFALGEGDRLVGRTDFDDYPPEAADVPAVATFTGVNIEQVVDIEPDLVLAGGNGFTPAADVSRMRELGMTVLVLYAQDLEGVKADIEMVGQAVGALPAAEDITADIDARIAEVSSAVAELEQPTVFYEIGYEPEIYGPAPDSFVADMVALAGGEPITTSDSAVFSISLEQLITEDPEVIVLGDAAYGTCPDAVAARPGWDTITAVEEDNVRPVNDLIVTRPGPRIGEGLAALALAIHPEAAIAPPADAAPELCAVP